jgi:hypothetical protein
LIHDTISCPTSPPHGIQKLSTRQISQWKKIRSRGKARFILINGGLGLGTMGIITLLISSLLNHHPVTWHSLGLTVVICPLFGLLGGNINWNSSEKAYQEAVLNPHPPTAKKRAQR